jgi:hypothetical protein
MQTGAKFFLRIKKLEWICTGLAAIFADTCHEVVVIDCGPKDDLSFATTERLGRNERGARRDTNSDFGHGLR